MERPQISIIVPVYKVEKYIGKCIDSIIAQNNPNWELLLIDDGSPDNSGKICDEYAGKDTRIRVFHKQNGGVSSARNLGLQHYRGEWVCFIDSDDYISPDFLNLPTHNKSLIIQKSYIKVDENYIETGKHSVESMIMSNKEACNRFFVKKRTSALWDKLFHKTIIGQNKFNEKISIGEDFLFYLSLFKDVQSYTFCSSGCYYYVERSGSAMGRINKDMNTRVNIMMENIQHICTILNKKEDDILRYGIIYQTYINALYSLRHYLTDGDFSLLKSYYKEMSLSKLRYVDYDTKFKLFLKRLLLILKSR